MSAATGQILVGTSGFSFPDWVGPFYPAGMKSSDFLSFYSRRFDIVEVNATYYRIPPPKTLEQMERKTPDGFRFVVKLHQAMTHEGARDPALFRDFLACLEPLRVAGKFDGLLAQFPWGFRKSPANLVALKSLREQLPGDPLYVEFRNDSWTAPDVLLFLREQQLGYCIVDEPHLQGLMPTVLETTTPDAYVRFHGRNAKNWWARSGPEGTAGDRYDYEYSREELTEWVKRVATLADRARRTYLFFNNCHAGQAARNAALMRELLRQQKLPA